VPEQPQQPQPPQPDARPPRLVLLTRPGCPLCDEARGVLKRVAAATGTGWSEVDALADASAELLDEYGDRLPVLLLDGSEHAYWRIEPERLQAALAGRRVW